VRITVLTAGHLSTSPRMLKAADALTAAGHDVRVVSTTHVEWAACADEDARRTRTWPWTRIDYSAATGGWLRLRTGARQRGATRASAYLGADAVPYPIGVRAFSRVHDELVRAALSSPADFFYGGTTGALAATAAAARTAGVPFGVDFEDFHRGEREGADGAMMNALAARIERDVLEDAACVTAAGTAIADEYQKACGIRPLPINNTFPLPGRAPEFASSGGPLSLYWFSQTIGESRGLEEVVRAIGLAGVPATLQLRGRAAPGFDQAMTALAASVAPNLDLRIIPPSAPDTMVECCRGFDVGLAVEQPVVRNREVCLSNKVFTYMLAGLAVVLTDTPGQRPVARDLGGHALVYEAGRPEQLADGLRRWHRDRPALVAARRAAWAAACERWHWDHPCERGALVSAIERAALRTRDQGRTKDQAPTAKDQMCASS